MSCVLYTIKMSVYLACIFNDSHFLTFFLFDTNSKLVLEANTVLVFYFFPLFHSSLELLPAQPGNTYNRA